MPLLGIGLKLLGIGKTIFGFILAVLKWIADFAQKRPLLFIAIVIDIALLYGCYKGYQAHQRAEKQAVQIVDLKKTIKDKDGLIELLHKRVKEYAKALTDSQRAHVSTIEQHNKAVQNIRREADRQLAEAQRIAAETRKQRDEYFRLSEKYRQAGKNCGDPAARIACEEALNKAFIEDMQKVKR